MSAVLILGESKVGKSTSLRNLDPKKTIVFSVLGKGMPFRASAKNFTIWDKEKNKEGNVVVTSSSEAITQWLKHISANMPHITVCVIDDATFLSAKTLDKRRAETTYFKFNDIAHDFLTITETANTLRKDLNVYFMYHTEKVGDGIIEKQYTRALSHGKMISEKLCSIEAQFEIAFLACKLSDKDDNLSYKFKTRDANASIGTPMGMYDEEYIDNDLQAIDQRIRCYYSADCNEEPVLVELKNNNNKKDE